MSKCKILLLAMCCNQPFFRKQADFLIKESYGKDVISGKYPDVDFFVYTASENGQSYIDYDGHMIYVDANDTLEGTFEKTQKTLRLLRESHIEYDWIMRSNCSSWINVPLLIHFINDMHESDRNNIFSNRIYSSKDSCGPDTYDFYGVGNGLLIPKFWCDVIADAVIDEIENRNIFSNASVNKIDDNAIGLICNDYADRHGMNKYEIWKSYRDVYSFGKITKDTFKSKDFLNFLVIPIRIYDRDRVAEYEYHRLLLNEIVDMDLDSVNIYEILTEYNIVVIVDFKNGKGICIPNFIATKFAKNCGNFDYDIENFLKNSSQNSKKQV